MMQEQRSVVDTCRFSAEQRAGTEVWMTEQLLPPEDLLDSNFTEHRDVSAVNLNDRFTEIRMDQYVRNFKGGRVWCDDLIQSVHVRFLDKGGHEITRLEKDRRSSKRILRFTHPYTGKVVCVRKTVGDHVLFVLCGLGEEMFRVHFLHYSFYEDKEGLTRRDVVYSPRYNHMVDYLLSTWENRSLPTGAMGLVRAVKAVRGGEYLWGRSSR